MLKLKLQNNQKNVSLEKTAVDDTPLTLAIQFNVDLISY